METKRSPAIALSKFRLDPSDAETMRRVADTNDPLGKPKREFTDMATKRNTNSAPTGRKLVRARTAMEAGKQRAKKLWLPVDPQPCFVRGFLAGVRWARRQARAKR